MVTSILNLKKAVQKVMGQVPNTPEVLSAKTQQQVDPLRESPSIFQVMKQFTNFIYARYGSNCKIKMGDFRNFHPDRLASGLTVDNVKRDFQISGGSITESKFALFIYCTTNFTCSRANALYNDLRGIVDQSQYGSPAATTQFYDVFFPSGPNPDTIAMTKFYLRELNRMHPERQFTNSRTGGLKATGNYTYEQYTATVKTVNELYGLTYLPTGGEPFFNEKRVNTPRVFLCTTISDGVVFGSSNFIQFGGLLNHIEGVTLSNLKLFDAITRQYGKNIFCRFIFYCPLTIFTPSGDFVNDLVNYATQNGREQYTEFYNNPQLVDVRI